MISAFPEYAISLIPLLHTKASIRSRLDEIATIRNVYIKYFNYSKK